MNCHACAAPIDVDDAFCRSCGTRTAPQPALVPESTEGSERRQLTAMFYDLVGSTAIGVDADPEDLQIATHAYQRRCTEVVRNFGGTPNRTMGDGGLVYFGFPIANEDDPLRAVSAGLAMLEELPELNRQIREMLPNFQHELQMRIGIHTGTVVLGAAGSDLNDGRLAVGTALNQAARIESVAPVNGVAVSDVTARRVRGVVELRSLGARELKGLDGPVEVFEVVRLRPGQGRFAVGTHPLSPMVGRDDLLGELYGLWERSAAGDGVTVVLRGDAGIGKSRAHLALRQRLNDTRHLWLRIDGAAVMNQTAFHPVIEAIMGTLELGPESDADAVLSGSIESVGIHDPEMVELLSVFLGLAPATDSSMSADERRRRTIDAICTWWIAIADTIPTVMVAEDLHWFDPSTLELLDLLSRRAAGHPLLLIGTSRPSTDIAWHDGVRTVDVEPLTLDEVNELLAQLSAGTDLTEMQRAQIALRSDGVPLFAEELMHSIVDGNFGDGTIPDTLVDLLTARLDRLGPAKEVVQVASLLGREFSAELLAAVLPDVPDLDSVLGVLLDGRMVARRGVGGRSVYLFRHALLQDAAQESMLRRRRQAEHRRIAEVLQREFAGLPEGRPEIVGHHLEQGGDVLRAVAQYTVAARRDRLNAALSEASARYLRSIELVRSAPQDEHRDSIELDLQLELAPVLGLTKAFSSPEVWEAYTRAVELSQQIGQGDAYAEALHGLAQHHFSGVRFSESAEVATRLLEYAIESGDLRAELLAHRALCQVRFWLGEYPKVQVHAERALALYRADAPASERYAMSMEHGVIAMTYGAVAHWALGRPHLAAELADRCIAHAAAQPDAYQLAYAEGYLSMVGIMINDPERVERWASDALAISERHGFLPLEGLARYTLAWAMAERGDPAAFDMVISGIGILAGLGTGLGAPGCMAVVAEMYAKNGEYSEAAGYVAFGESMAEPTGQHFYTVELHRSAALAHLGLAESAADEAAREVELVAAESRSRQAIDLARQQQSPSLELRAVQPLIEVYHRRGDLESARALLQSAVDKFPADSRGNDLDRARAALENATVLRPALRFYPA